ncbi:C-X-C chemokine receptor type 2-like [Trichomycterus rosablanca]|uniref:C-X-C chemokine receptor type 2-like n=1 Tax=Trichomycterus rosablanca TaxID=2290929 RepID=UPI002F350058
MQHLNSSNSSTIYLPPEKIAASCVMALCFLLGVPGNIAVMVRLAGWIKGDSFTTRLMMSLAASDLLNLLSLPLWIFALLHSWIFGLFLCKFLSYMVYLNLYCSILCVILLSVQRYIQILHPQKWSKLGRRGQKILVSGVWLLSGVFASYSLIRRTVLRNNRKLMCVSDYQNDIEQVATSLWETLLLAVSFLILTYFYFHLYTGVNRLVFLKSHKIAKLLTRIVVIFFACWVPYFINNIVLIAAVLLKNGSVIKLAKSGNHITRALTFINSCVNPFLYAFSSRALRQQPAETEKSEAH